MKRYYALVLILASLLCSAHVRAQQDALPNAPDPEWQKVQALPSGVPIVVRSNAGNMTCAFKSASSDALACLHGTEMTLQRGSIRSVQTYNRPGSMALMAAVGAGVGVLTVKAVSAGIGFHGWAKGSAYAGGAAVGAAVFIPIGYFAHPLHRTIYKAQ